MGAGVHCGPPICGAVLGDRICIEPMPKDFYADSTAVGVMWRCPGCKIVRTKTAPTQSGGTGPAPAPVKPK